jgi:hypothetical protein
MVTNEEAEIARKAVRGKADLPEPRWELINGIYDKLDQLICDEVNRNELTFIEVETIMKLMNLKLLKCEINHLVGISMAGKRCNNACNGCIEGKNNGCYT